MAAILKQYKLPNGATNYPAIFSVPVNDRIPVLAKHDFTRVNLLIIGALTMAFEAMNQKRGMNEFQILSLAEEIIDTSNEDNLSLEDLLLFLQNLVRGKYKIAYESFDIPKFMELFEIYRQERHSTILKLREEQHLQWKGMGSADRSFHQDALSEHFGNFANSLSNIRENLKELKKENKKLKDIDNF